MISQEVARVREEIARLEEASSMEAPGSQAEADAERLQLLRHRLQVHQARSEGTPAPDLEDMVKLLEKTFATAVAGIIAVGTTWPSISGF